MDNANVAHIKNVYAAFLRADLPAVLASLTPDVTWGMVGRPQDVPFAGVREGKAGAAEFFRLLDETQDLKNFEPREFVTSGDMVFCWGRYDWTMRDSGVSGSSDWLHVFTLKDGKGRPDLVLFENAAAVVDVTMGMETDVAVTYLTRSAEFKGQVQHVYRYTSAPGYLKSSGETAVAL